MNDGESLRNDAEPGQRRTPEESRRLRRRILALVALFAFAGLSILVLNRFVSADAILRHYDALLTLVRDHFAFALTVYVAAYVLAVSLSLPGAVLLTALGGLLFGWKIGGTAAVLAAGTGAVVIFLIARTTVGPLLVRDAGPLMARISRGLQENVVSYLLFLRLTPLVPFFVVNVAAALFGVRLRTFVLCTYLGIIPATFAFSAAGSALDGLVRAQKKTFDACRATGELACSFDLSLKTLATPGLMAALVALGCIALLPVVLKRLGLLKRAERES
jgi:uncharacterized membrane protein YdjX (TVP38/TMEM64 family)